jgi:hypothetical protein
VIPANAAPESNRKNNVIVIRFLINEYSNRFTIENNTRPIAEAGIIVCVSYSDPGSML